MARRAKACATGGRGCASFLRYLESTIIPDTWESGRTGTAKDLEAVTKFLRGARSVRIGSHSYSRSHFIDYLRGTLIPDLEESGSTGYVEDFEEAVQHLRRLG